MLELIIAPFEFYLEEKNEFITFNEPTKLQLEHSLVSISKWESKWHKPYLITNSSQEPPTEEQAMDYLRCMMLNDAPFDVVYGLTKDQAMQIKEYIENPMTATTVKHGADKPGKGRRRTGEVITSELIYYWMASLQIPFQPCETWHINRLLMLIEVANIKNNPDKKMNNNDVLKANRQLNAARRAKLHTKG